MIQRLSSFFTTLAVLASLLLSCDRLHGVAAAVNNNDDGASNVYLRGVNREASTVTVTGGEENRQLMPGKCGCDSCTDQVWNAVADGYPCGNRIDWVIGNMGYSEEQACLLVANEEYPSICGGCDPSSCTNDNGGDPVVPDFNSGNDSFNCGCSSCTDAVWNTPATDAAGAFPCGDRISWLEATDAASLEQLAGITTGPFDMEGACRFVSEEFPDLCGACHPDNCVDDNGDDSGSSEAPSDPPLLPTKEPTASPTKPPTQSPTKPPTPSPTKPPTPSPVEESTDEGAMCGCPSCTQDVLNTVANGYECGSRMNWVMENMGMNEFDSCKLVADEYPDICGVCHSDHCGDFPPTPTPVSMGTVKVMSYNTEYTGYYDGRMPAFAAKIAEVGADVVGLQECQDPNGLASASGYSLLTNTGPQNYILYNANRLEVLDRGTMNIPRDDYAQRALTWGKFRIREGSGAGAEFWFFNTHLPHRHNQAADPNTHARIGRSLIAKRNELGAANTPTIVVGDCNPFASSGAPEGSFESSLRDGGIPLIYVATGQTGGYAGLDKIFASADHWTGVGSDVGTGRSDHPAIAADMTLIG